MKPGTTKTPTDRSQLDSAARVRRHREILRARGMRLVTRWVLDTRKPKFVRQYRTQVAVLAAHPEKPGFVDWMNRISSTEGWV